jgi:beta-glucosidase/6-phospho-beta-glucosidase/beta-galactosidase
MFESFFLAGFECATGRNRHGHAMDQICATGHETRVEEDYAALRAVGIRAAREGIRWPLVDQARRCDFSSVAPFVRAARAHKVQVIWDLFHYGYPADLDPFSDAFVDRFASYCHACARYLRRRSERACWYTVVNEPSYLAWAGAEAGVFPPYARGRAGELKRNLARAAIAGIDAIRSVDPEARFLNVDRSAGWCRRSGGPIFRRTPTRSTRARSSRAGT